MQITRDSQRKVAFNDSNLGFSGVLQFKMVYLLCSDNKPFI